MLLTLELTLGLSDCAPRTKTKFLETNQSEGFWILTSENNTLRINYVNYFNNSITLVLPSWIFASLTSRKIKVFVIRTLFYFNIQQIWQPIVITAPQYSDQRSREAVSRTVDEKWKMWPHPITQRRIKTRAKIVINAWKRDGDDVSRSFRHHYCLSEVYTRFTLQLQFQQFVNSTTFTVR